MEVVWNTREVDNEVLVVGWRVVIGGLEDQLLDQVHGEQEYFVSSQSVSHAETFSYSKRNDSLIHDKASIIVDESAGIEGVGILEVLRVLHDGAQVGLHNCSLWKCEPLICELFCCLVT